MKLLRILTKFLGQDFFLAAPKDEKGPFIINLALSRDFVVKEAFNLTNYENRHGMRCSFGDKKGNVLIFLPHMLCYLHKKN